MMMSDEFPFNYHDLPLRDSIDEFVKNGRPLGDFLMSILCNDLSGACGRADNTNIHLLPTYVAYLYNETPAGCHGSVDLVSNWSNIGGLDGQNKLREANDNEASV